MDEYVIDEFFQQLVGPFESGTGISRSGEMIGEGFDFLDDVSGGRMVLFQVLDQGEDFQVGLGIGPHQREHQPFFPGKMFFQFGFQGAVEMMEPGEQFPVVDEMDKKNLVQVRFDFRHVVPFIHMVSGFQVLEHVRDGKVLEPFQGFLLAAGFSAVGGNEFIQVRHHLFRIQIRILHSFFQRYPPAAAVIQVEFIEKGNGLGIIPDNVSQSILHSNHGTFLPICLVFV